MKISPVQQRIEHQRIKDHQNKIRQEHQEYIRRVNQKKPTHPSKGQRIDQYV